jgi:taurine dioxygenase
MDDQAIDTIDALIRDYKVVVFPGQGAVDPLALARFAARFGAPEIVRHPIHTDSPETPAVKVLHSDGRGYGGEIGDTWHTDGSQREQTNWLSFLQAIDVPDYGRDTLFADMEAAFDGLSEATQTFLGGLTAMHSWGADDPTKPSVEHPVIYTDPRTNRKCIYVNQQYTRKIVGMSTAESEAILKFAYSLAYKPEYHVRVSWQPGTIVIWDNQRTQHYLVQDRVHDRVMHRSMVLRPWDANGPVPSVRMHESVA